MTGCTTGSYSAARPRLFRKLKYLVERPRPSTKRMAFLKNLFCNGTVVEHAIVGNARLCHNEKREWRKTPAPEGQDVKRTLITRKMAWHSIYRWGSKKAPEVGRKRASLMSVTWCSRLGKLDPFPVPVHGTRSSCDVKKAATKFKSCPCLV